jgi:hypothetical protein
VNIPTLVSFDSRYHPGDWRAAADPKAETWLDARGDVFAHCHARDGRHWISVPGKACFCFEPHGSPVTMIPHPSADPEALAELYERSVLPMVLQARGTEVLHASAVLTPHGVLALCAATGTGKSTLAYGLFRRGYPVWADDGVALDLPGSAVRVLPLPFEMHLRPSATAFFGLDGKDPAPAPCRSQEEAACEPPAPLAALCVLTRSQDKHTIKRLSPASAFAALLPHAYCFSLKGPAPRRKLVERYLAITAHVPVFEVRFQPQLEWLDMMLDRIEETIVTPRDRER